MSRVKMIKGASNGRDWILWGCWIVLIVRWRGGSGWDVEMIIWEVGLAEKSNGFGQRYGDGIYFLNLA
jgi:hypothetical protein